MKTSSIETSGGILNITIVFDYEYKDGTTSSGSGKATAYFSKLLPLTMVKNSSFTEVTSNLEWVSNFINLNLPDFQISI